jgi:hypothetical protein
LSYLAGFFEAAGQFDTACFASAPYVNLRFNDHRRIQLGGYTKHIIHTFGNLPFNYGYAVARENFLGLIFMDLHL